MIPVSWSETVNANAIGQIRMTGGADTLAACILIDKSLRAPLALFCFGVPEIGLVALYASAIVFIGTINRADTFWYLGVKYKCSRALFTLFSLIVPEERLVTSEADLVAFIRSVNGTSAFVERNVINIRQGAGITGFCLLVPKIWRLAVNTGVVLVQVGCLWRACASLFDLTVCESWWAKFASARCGVIVWSTWAGNAFVAIPQSPVVGTVHAWFPAWIEIRILFAALAFSCLSTPVSWQVTSHTILPCTVR